LKKALSVFWQLKETVRANGNFAKPSFQNRVKLIAMFPVKPK